MKILIADDEEQIRRIVKKYGEFEGYEVAEAADGLEAVRLCREKTFDVVILDVMMPQLDGFSACREIRKMCQTPVIMLSARGEEYDRLHGFDLGADDYVVKPFSPKELMMRVAAILKRSGAAPGRQKDVRNFGGLSVDLSARTVTVDGERRELSPKEFDLLACLIENKGIALTRDRLLDHVWGYDFFGDGRTLDTHIKLLRQKIRPYDNYIVTLRGVGYRFDESQR